jgi:hypothetical protein
LENNGRLDCEVLNDAIQSTIRGVDELAHAAITITMEAVTRRKHQMLFD